jgi:alpha-1,2-mannosyltransferase
MACRAPHWSTPRGTRKGIMTEFEKTAAAWALPPLGRGLPLIFLSILALVYAWLAIPLTLVPHSGLHTLFGGMVGNDFLSFYSVATMEWRHSAADAFDLARLTQLQSAISGTGLRLPFPYPPPFLLYVAPLAAMPYLTALYFWIGATAAPFVWIARRMSGLALPLVALAPPLVQNAIDGQNGALTASLFAGGLMALTGRRPALAGILFGLLSYKPQVFVLIPICLLAARQYRALAWVAATAAFLVLASLAAFGFDAWLKFLDALSQEMSFIRGGHLPVGRCPTVFMSFLEVTGSVTAANVAQGVSTLAAWAFVAWTWRRTDAVFPRALAFCVALPFSTPYMLEYDLAVWTLPASILLARLWRGEGSGPDFSGLALLWLSPSLIWLASLADLRGVVLAPLLLAPYAVWAVRRETPAVAQGEGVAAPA